MNDRKTAEPGGGGVRWRHLAATIVLALIGLAVIRGHIRHDPDADDPPATDTDP